MGSFRCKLKSGKGFSLTELLVTVLILSVFTVSAVAVAGSATKTYRESLFISESTSLSDTINSALNDILRFSTPSEGKYFSFEEYDNSYFYLNDGKIILHTPNRTVPDNSILADGAYGKLRVSDLSLVNSGRVFLVIYTINGSSGLSRQFYAYIRTISQK